MTDESDQAIAEIGHNGGPPLPLEFPEKMVPFLSEQARFKVAKGGRGGAKSWSIARLLVMKAMYEKHLILCAREFQTSIADSVHALLVSQIDAMGLVPFFYVTDTEIFCRVTGTRFIFKGLRRNIQEIKSTEGVTICWVEEAQAVSEHSWKILTPTIRAKGSEIWLSFNPQDEEDATYQRFVLKPPPGTLNVTINWNDNPWFPEELESERAHMQATDPDAYDWVWGGKCRHISEATIFRGNYEIVDFDTPENAQFMFGADWGFATDPTALVRCWVEQHGGPGKDILHIDYEAYGHKVELDDLQYLFGGGKAQKNGAIYPGIPKAKDYPIKGDSSRPETISFMNGQGFFVKPAAKWEGCVEDGVEFLKAYKKIRIHPRCKHMAQEARLYSYVVDPRNGDILPKVADKHNHLWDAVRYSHDGIITKSGGLGVWRKLASQIQ
jgi:phage terminase large subunit